MFTPYHAIMFNLSNYTETHRKIIELIELLWEKVKRDWANFKQTHFEDDSEPKPLLLAVQLDVANYILYFCSSVDLVDEICYYRVSIDEAKAFDGFLYFQIEVDKESAIKINFDAIFQS